MLTDHIVHLDSNMTENPELGIKQLIAARGKPIIRAATGQAMRIMGNQYALGRDTHTRSK